MSAGAAAQRDESQREPDIVFVGSLERRGNVGTQQGVFLLAEFANRGGDASSLFAELRYGDELFIAHGHWCDRASQRIWLRTHEIASVVVALRTAKGELFAFEDSRQFGTAYSLAEHAEHLRSIPLKAARQLRLVIKANHYRQSFEFDLDLKSVSMSCRCLS